MFLLCATLIVVLSIAAGYMLGTRHYKEILSRVHITRETNSPYKFIGPLLNVVFPKEIGESEFAPIVSKIQQTVAGRTKGTLDHYSVYFRDLTTSHWTGINENDQYNPASLLKIVIAIAAYKKQEEDKTFFLSPTHLHTRII